MAQVKKAADPNKKFKTEARKIHRAEVRKNRKPKVDQKVITCACNKEIKINRYVAKNSYICNQCRGNNGTN